MRVLSRILHDIKRGENIDLYVTVAVALGLAALNLMGIAPETWIAPITLAILGLLAISTLGSRYRFEESLQKFTQSIDTFFLEEFPTSFKNDFEVASELWLVGVTLSRTVKTYYSDLERKLSKGDTVKVLLVSPEGAAAEMAETRVYGRSDVERTRREIRGILQDLCDLRQIAPDKLQIRTIQNPLGYGAVAVNPMLASGVLYLEHYPFKTIGGSLPKFILRAKDGRWYDFFRDEIGSLWDNGIEWKCDEKDFSNADKVNEKEQGELIIHSAKYGAQSHTVDVTSLVGSKVSSGRLEIFATNANLGGDPAKGVVKELEVVYYYAGRKHSVLIPEGEKLILP